MRYLQISAGIYIPVGPILIAATGLPDTTTSMTSANFKLLVQGGSNSVALATGTNSAALMTGEVDGTRLVQLEAADVGTLGTLDIVCIAAGDVGARTECQVVPAVWFNNVSAASGGSVPAVAAGAANGLSIVGSAMTLSSAERQALDKKIWNCSGTVWHVATAAQGGSESNDGLTWATAKLTPKTIIEAGAFGDKILIGAGTYTIAVGIAQPAGVDIIGYGAIMDGTGTNQNSNGAVFTPGAGCRIKGVKFLVSSGGNIPIGYQIPVGGLTNIIWEDCWFAGYLDCVAFAAGGSGTAVDMVFKRCRFTTLSINADTIYPGNLGFGSFILEDCLFEGTGSGPDFTSGTNATLINCKLTNGVANITAEGTARVVVVDCDYDPAKIVGTITQAPPLANLVTMAGTDGKAKISADSQDLSGTLSVNAKKLNAATPNNIAAQDVANSLKLAPAAGTPTSGSAYDLLNSAVSEATSAADSAAALIARLGAWVGTGVNTVLGAFRALLSKTAAAPSDIGGTFDPATDSVEAIREQTDANAVSLAAIAARTNLLGANAWQFSSPVSAQGDIEIVQGDDYSDNDALTLTTSTYTGPDLTGATGELRLVPAATYQGEDDAEGVGATTTIPAASVTQDGQTVACVFRPTAVQTAALETSPPGEMYNYVYQVAATTTGGKVHTLATGSLRVRRAVT